MIGTQKNDPRGGVGTRGGMDQAGAPLLYKVPYRAHGFGKNFLVRIRGLLDHEPAVFKMTEIDAKVDFVDDFFL